MTDHQGSVRDLARVTSGTASVVNHIVYDAFGETVSETDAAIAHLYGYTGKELDKETGLQYNRARYLDLVLARWISQDPIGFAGGDANLYRYVGNSPTNATDPSGLVTSQDPPFQRGWGGFFWDWTGGLFFPSTQTAHSKAISLAEFANHENNVDRTRANANARVFQQLDPNFGVGQNRPSPPAGVMSGQENGLQQAETAIRAAAELPVEFMAAASGMSRPSSGGASIPGGGSGNPKANAPSGSFGGIVANTAEEAAFLRNAAATFGDSSVFSSAKRFSGSIVIQRSDIPFSVQNVRSMAAGRTPFVRNSLGEWEKLNLHHVGRQDGKLIEVLGSHNRYDNITGGPLHIPGSGGPIRDATFTQNYWRQRLQDAIDAGLVPQDVLRQAGL
jgi:RHS repeat-associated protein